MIMSGIETFEERGKELSAQISDCEHKSIVFSCLRFVTFIIFIACTVAGYINGFIALYFIAAVFLCGFILLCSVHGKINDRLKYLTALYSVNSGYIYRMTGDFDGLMQNALAGLTKADEKALNTEIHNGDEFYESSHDYCQDFSLFGKKSIFTLLNTSETVMGRKAFADKLLNAPVTDMNNEQLKRVQEACKELSADTEFLQKFQATAAMGDLRYSDEDLRNLFVNRTPMKASTRILYRLLPLLWLIPVAILFIIPQYSKAAVLGVLIVNLIVWGAGLLRNRDYLPSSLTIRKCKTVRDMYLVLENAGFKSDYLRELVAAGMKDNNKVSDIMNSLCRILGFAELRSQPLFALILNMILPLDYLVSDLMSSWNSRYGAQLDKVIDDLGEVESLSSQSQIVFTADEYVFPSFVDSLNPGDNAYFEGEGICHPLLYPGNRVANSVLLNSNIALITGSNMSGKTTLIRTVGICALLAYMGGPVPARALTLGKMRIMSSMRIVDSLEENMSTFKAELVRISGIVNAGKEGRPLLFLIDEIFRGTNSDDRTAGAYTVLRNLSQTYICGMMTTHDYALVDKTEHVLDRIVYYHFSESYSDTGISFDYKLTPGISRSSNAAFLMKLVGIDKGDE